ncbi:MAG: site-2 protease family protein [Ruminococcaceae bacterium]|nr:site-2 protease family protein [Oscillospiraceae bacterium]
MLFSLLSTGDIKIAIIQLILTVPIVLFALSCHEAAHAYAAYKMGDRTAFNLGRLTINPAKHLDLWGTLCMIAFGFGWAKPVPINARNFRNPKRGMAITGIAGPLANFLLGVISTFLYIFTLFLQIKYFWSTDTTEFVYNIFYITQTFFYLSAMYNFVFMVFNLIPIPPFDGSRFITAFLPAKWYFMLMQYERYSFLIVMAINLILSRVFGVYLTSTIASWVMDFVAFPFEKLFTALL